MKIRHECVSANPAYWRIVIVGNVTAGRNVTNLLVLHIEKNRQETRLCFVGELGQDIQVSRHIVSISECGKEMIASLGKPLEIATGVERRNWSSGVMANHNRKPELHSLEQGARVGIT